MARHEMIYHTLARFEIYWKIATQPCTANPKPFLINRMIKVLMDFWRLDCLDCIYYQGHVLQAAKRAAFAKDMSDISLRCCSSSTSVASVLRKPSFSLSQEETEEGTEQDWKCFRLMTARLSLSKNYSNIHQSMNSQLGSQKFVNSQKFTIF